MTTYAIVFSTTDNTDMANINADSVLNAIESFQKEIPGSTIHSVINTDTNEETEINSDIFDFCKSHYELYDCYPGEVELSDDTVLNFKQFMLVLTEEQKEIIENQ